MTTSHKHVQEQPLLRVIEYFPFRILSNVVGDPQLNVTTLDTDMDGIATVGWGGMILQVSTGFKIQLQVSFWLQLRPGEYSTYVYRGRLRSEVQPLTLLYTIFHEKDTPFVCLLLTKWYTYLFTYLV